jgi:hypothetical protein
MIVTVGPRKAAVLEDEPTAAYPWTRLMTESAVAVGPQVDDTVRAAVETLRQAGGLRPRALIGGYFTPRPDHSDVVFEVGVSGVDLNGDPKVVSQLWDPLMLGLPAEFADAVVDGLRRRPLPAGRLVVDRAGYDPVDSSPLAFELSAELLATVLVTRAAGGDVQSVVRVAVQAWP